MDTNYTFTPTPHNTLLAKKDLIRLHPFLLYHPQQLNTLIFFYDFLFCKSPDTQGLKATSRCGLQLFLSRGRCHLLLGLKQGYPFYSPYGCRLGYHQSEAWPVEQKALHVPPQFYVASVTTGIRTHTLLIKQQSLNPVLLTAQP